MKKSKVLPFLALVAAFWAFCFVTLKCLLLPYSVAYAETGKMTFGYFLYAFIGIVFSTPAPFLSVLILTVFREKSGLRPFFSNIFHTKRKKEAALFTGGFCLLTLIYALLEGTPNGSPWYMLPLGFLIMIPFVGIAEETGWRGFLQPTLEEKIGFIPATLLTASIWYVWHLDLWLDPTSNHYGDSLLGFGITIFIWAFAEAALYKATKSVMACAIYHAFVDAIGAVYDWNLLFDAFPGNLSTNLFRILWLFLSFALYVWAKKHKTPVETPSNDELASFSL